MSVPICISGPIYSLIHSFFHQMLLGVLLCVRCYAEPNERQNRSTDLGLSSFSVTVWMCGLDKKKTNNVTLWVSSVGMGWCGGSDGKESPCTSGNPSLIPESGRFPEGGNGYLLQYSCLENPLDRRAWRLQSMRSQRVRHD